MIFIDFCSMGKTSSFLKRSLHLEHMFVGLPGLQLKGQLAMVWIGGKISERALTKRDLPEPFGPEIRAPPILGSITLRSKTVFALS